jgi:hypothetical protein
MSALASTAGRYTATLATRVGQLLLHPSAEFARLSSTPESVGTVFKGWILPLVSVMVVANLLVAVVFGISSFTGSVGMRWSIPFAHLPRYALPVFVQSLVMPFVMAAVINLLAAPLGAQKSYLQALRTAAYVATPAWIVGIFGPAWHQTGFTSVAPPRSWALFIGAFWSIYFLFRALAPMMKTPPRRVLPYTAAVVAIMLVLWTLAMRTTFATISDSINFAAEEGYPEEISDAFDESARPPAPVYRDATPEEAAEALELSRSALWQLDPAYGAAAVANAIRERWRASGDIEIDAVTRYEVRGSEVVDNLEGDASSRGVKAGVGVELAGNGPIFETGVLYYLIFDDPALARAYFNALDNNLGAQVTRIVRTFELGRSPGSIPLNCVYVPQTAQAINCHFLGPDDRVVAVLLLSDGPDVDVVPGTDFIETILANNEARKRAVGASGIAARYLWDVIEGL